MCGNCGNESREGQRYCNKCHSEYMKTWRKKNPLSDLQKIKDTCRSYAGVYLRRGLITKKPCEICNSEGSQMHHEDYSKPLEIKWLCRRHHLDLHKPAKSYFRPEA